jgi:hypothetical protein
MRILKIPEIFCAMFTEEWITFQNFIKLEDYMIGIINDFSSL